MARGKTGWFGESRRHWLASKGVSTKSANAPRVPQLPRPVGYGQHQSFMRRFVVGKGFLGKGLQVTKGSLSGEGIWIEPGEVVEVESISPNGTIWILYKNRRYCAGTITDYSEVYPHYDTINEWLTKNVGQELK